MLLNSNGSLNKSMKELKRKKNAQRQIKKKKKDNDPKLLDAAKVILRREFVAIQSYLKKEEKSQINNLNLHLKQLEREQSPNLVKEIIKIRTEMNEIDTKKTKAKFNEIKI